jgi:hypothetical protein
MNPGSDVYLLAFSEAYRWLGACYVGIGAMPPDATDVRQAQVLGAIYLTQISITMASDVGPDDFEFVAIAPITDGTDDDDQVGSPPSA